MEGEVLQRWLHGGGWSEGGGGMTDSSSIEDQQSGAEQQEQLVQQNAQHWEEVQQQWKRLQQQQLQAQQSQQLQLQQQLQRPRRTDEETRMDHLVGTCTVCLRDNRRLVDSTGLLHHHGSRHAPCAVSHTRPALGSVRAVGSLSRGSLAFNRRSSTAAFSTQLDKLIPLLPARLQILRVSIVLQRPPVRVHTATTRLTFQTTFHIISQNVYHQRCRLQPR